jgi:hypothetical protein
MGSWLACLWVEDGAVDEGEDEGIGCGTPPDEVA